MSCAHLTKTSTNHPLFACRNHIEISLYDRLIKETDWLDDKALAEIKRLFFRSRKRTFYTENLLHRLEQIRSQIDIPFLRHNFNQLKDISFDIACVFINQILLNNSIKVKNDPKELLADFYLYANDHNIFCCQLPIVNTPFCNLVITQLNKLKCNSWWLTNIKTTSDQQRELLRIALGKVHYRNQRYASNEAVQNYKREARACFACFCCNRLCCNSFAKACKWRNSDSIQGCPKLSQALFMIASILHHLVSAFPISACCLLHFPHRQLC